MTAIRVLSDTLQSIYAPNDGTYKVEQYDLMYLSTDDVRPASSATDLLVELQNQIWFASRFAGIACDAREVADGAKANFPVAPFSVVMIDCVSNTFNLMDLVAIAENDAGTALMDNKVKKTTDRNAAIGVVLEQYSSATTRIKVALISRVYKWDLSVEDALPTVVEFDFETTGGTGTAAVTVAAGSLNTKGWVFYDAFGVVSEVFGGASQDQGVLTLADTADNALGTLTPSDSGADNLNDIVACTNRAVAQTTGTAIKTIAAGVGIKATITQQTAGTGEAGKLKLILVLRPLS
jgi:hypothetical protein